MDFREFGDDGSYSGPAIVEPGRPIDVPDGRLGESVDEKVQAG